MIGNNSCGSTAQAYGKMADSVRRLEILTYDGLRTWTGLTSDVDYEHIVAAGGRKADIYRRLRAIRDNYLGLIRTRYPDIPRRVSGYNLDYLLPEKQFHVAKALVGSESTLVTVLTAEIKLVEIPKFRSLVVLGYPDVTLAADLVPLVNAHHPLACEGLDDVLISLEREEHLAGHALDKLPEGSGWLMVMFGGDTQDEARDRAQALIDAAQADGDHPKPHVAYLEDPAVEDNLWKVRELGLGATAYPPGKHETHEGWEDAAVPPERLGDYLRDFRTLLARHDYHGSSLYGHFGHGCVHTRTPFELRTAGGIAAYRSFVEEAADLVVSYGGSLSGEHGDGQSRGELLPKMFGPELIRAFGEMKDVFDPDDRMNPGKVVRPYRLDENLTLRGWFPREPQTFFGYPHDGGKFARAASRCVGVGKCRGDEGGVMCPSYRVTREEEHSTRGRARLLMEMVRGDVISEGWHSTEVRDALDLCLACKGCRKECPVGVDMATYKAEFLAHHYAGRLQARGALLDGLAPAAGPADHHRARPGRGGEPGRPYSGTLLCGQTGRGNRPAADVATLRRADVHPWHARHRRVPSGRRVILWPDTFSNNFHPEVAQAAVTVLERAGFQVEVPGKPLCCGLTWISTGQLGMAGRMLRRTIRALRPALRPGCRWWSSSRAARRCSAPTRPNSSAPTTPGCSPTAPGPWPSCSPRWAGARTACWRASAGMTPAATGAAAPSPRCTATSTPSWALTRTPRSCAAAVSTSTCSTPGAAGWPGTSASSAGTTTCPWPAPSGYCCPRSGTRRRTRSCWPTGSPVAPRSSRPHRPDPRAPSRVPGVWAAPYWPKRGWPGRTVAAGGPSGTAWPRRLCPPGWAGRGRRGSRRSSYSAPDPVAYRETPPPVTTLPEAASRARNGPTWWPSWAGCRNRLSGLTVYRLRVISTRTCPCPVSSVQLPSLRPGSLISADHAAYELNHAKKNT